MTIGERCRGLHIRVTPVRRGEGPLTTPSGPSGLGTNCSALAPSVQIQTNDSPRSRSMARAAFGQLPLT
jgi:hypothetical protein